MIRPVNNFRGLTKEKFSTVQTGCILRGYQDFFLRYSWSTFLGYRYWGNYAELSVWGDDVPWLLRAHRCLNIDRLRLSHLKVSNRRCTVAMFLTASPGLYAYATTLTLPKPIVLLLQMKDSDTYTPKKFCSLGYLSN